MELVGRHAERMLLSAEFARVDGGLHCVVVRGEPGIGKSAVLAHAADLARQRGWTVVAGGVTAVEQQLSWSGIASLVHSVPAEVVQRLPDVHRLGLVGALGDHLATPLADRVNLTPSGSIDGIRVAEGMRALVEHLVGDGPLCVIIDDAHWLDAASAGAMSLVVRSLADRMVTVILATRPTGPVMDVERLVDPDMIRVVDIEGLAHGAIHQILSARFGIRLGGVDLERLHDTSRGNPLHVVETARLLRSGMDLDRALLPQSLVAAVAAGLSMLPDDVREVLATAALMATPTFAALAAMHGAGPAEDALVLAEKADVIHLEEGEIRFRHPLLRAGVIDDMGEVERRRAHRRLSELVDDPEERAVHLGAAAWGADEDAAAAMDDAAERASRRGAHVLGAQRALHALELTPADDVDARRRRRLVAADATFAAGRAPESCRLFREALADAADAEQAAESLYGLIISTATAEGDVAASEIAEQLAALPDVDRRWHIRALELLSRLRLAFDLGASEEAALAAIAAAAELDDASEFELEPVLMVVRVLRGEPVDLSVLARRPTDGHWTLASLAIGEVLVWCDLLDAALDMQLYELARAEERGNLMGMLNALDQLSDVATRLGRWDEAADHLSRFAELSVRMGADERSGSRLADLALLEALRGRFEQATELLARADVHQGQPRRIEEAQIRIRAGMVALHRGDPRSAVDHLRRGRASLVQMGLVDPGPLLYVSDYVEALVACGELTEADVVTRELEAVAQRCGRPRAALEAARSKALLANASGDLDGASAAVADAFEALSRLQAPFELARVHLIAGLIARRTNHRLDARRHLQAARDGFAALGAAPFVERTDRELARLGSTNPNVLTPTEEQIAQLVAEGLSNGEVAARLFITRRTVEANLTRVYRKLGVRSRTELVAQLHRQ